jgi:protein gp37
MTDQIDLDALLDGSITEHYDGVFTEFLRPGLHAVEIDGQTWVSDRHILLLLDVLQYGSDDWDIQQMPANSADAARQWVAQLRTSDLQPATAAEFAPSVAGVLTLAGYTARAVPGWKQMHALLDAAGDLAGILMSYPEPPQRSLPIPCSDETIAMYRRLDAADVARPWQCWEFAALLTTSRSGTPAPGHHRPRSGRGTDRSAMSAATAIEWTEVTWNPTTGCDRISPGCDRCYALTLAKRLKAMGSAKYQIDGDPRTSGPGFGVAVHPGALDQPMRWRTPRRVFVNSMSDLGHARLPRAALARIWAVMALTGRHQFQVLTKRPRRLAMLLADNSFLDQVAEQASDITGRTPAHLGRWRLDLGGQRLTGDSGLGGAWSTTPSRSGTLWSPPWPLPNVWLGTSIESDDYCWRAGELRGAPAAVRFLSCEPLLGPLPSLDLTGIDWVIVGGESGAGSRPLDLDWARDLRDRSTRQRSSFFLKQIGGPTPKAGGRMLDGRTWDEYPVALPAARRG